MTHEKDEISQRIAAVGASQLIHELTGEADPDLWRRRTIIGLSLVGAASMTAVSLLQTGILKRLPDPPIRGFDSDKVNLSKDAFLFGLPDGTLTLAGFAANVPLAASGGKGRAAKRPWIPILAAAKAAVEAAGAAIYFYKMPTKEKAWCGYCIVGAIASVGVLALTLSEARRATRALFR